MVVDSNVVAVTHDIRNLVNFNEGSSKSENFIFDVLLMSEVHYA